MHFDTVGQLDREAASFSTRTVARATQVSSYFTRMGHSMKDSSSISVVGIDVSKETLDVFFTKNGRFVSSSIHLIAVSFLGLFMKLSFVLDLVLLVAFCFFNKQWDEREKEKYRQEKENCCDHTHHRPIFDQRCCQDESPQT